MLLKQFKTLCCFAFVICMSGAANAGGIVVLGLEQALLSSNAAKEFQKTVKKELSSQESEVVELEKQAKAAQEKLQKNRDLVSEAELKKMGMQFQKVFSQYQSKGKALQQARAEKEQAFIASMRPKLDVVIRDLIKQEDFDLIISKNATLYSKNTLDITPKVVEMLNKQ